MSFSINSILQAECSSIYVAKPHGEILYELNGIDVKSVKYMRNFNDISTITFDVNRWITIDGEKVESSGYQYLSAFMELFVDGIGKFQMAAPELHITGDDEYKTVTASSIEAELMQYDLDGIKVNCGTSDSAEYLAQNNLNEETGLPEAYLTLYNDGSYIEGKDPALDKHLRGEDEDTSIFRYELVDNSVTEIRLTRYTGKSKNVVIPSELDGHTVTEIGDYCFDSTHTEEASFMGSGYLEDMTVINNVYIPDTINKIGQYAFYKTDIETIYLPDSITEIGECCFMDCSELKIIRFPMSQSFSTIPDSAFRRCIKLKYLFTPDNITHIAVSAFMGCTGIMSVNSAATFVGASAFSGCTGIRELVFHNIFECKANAFLNVHGTAGDDELVIFAPPDGTKAIVQIFKGLAADGGWNAHKLSSNYSTLPGLYIDDSTAGQRILKCSSAQTSGDNWLILSESDNITRIDASVFSYNSNIHYVYTPKGVSRIDLANTTTVRNIVFRQPNAEQSPLSNLVTEYNIRTRRNIRYFNTPQGYIFFDLNDNNVPRNYLVETNTSLYHGTALFRAGYVRLEDYYYNEEYLGKKATSYGAGKEIYDQDYFSENVLWHAFYEPSSAILSYSKLKSVSLSNRVKYVQDDAFYGCSQLENIDLSHVSHIGSAAFRECYSLNGVELPESLNTMYQDAFIRCDSLDYVSFNSNVTLQHNAVGAKIGNPDRTIIISRSDYTAVRTYIESVNQIHYFTDILSVDDFSTDDISGGKEITGYSGSDPIVVVPEHINGVPVVSIGDNAFGGHASLREIRIPPTVNNVGNYAFSGCNSLERIVCSDESVSYLGISTVGNYAFNGCESLTSFAAPQIMSIGDYAFNSCSSLEYISPLAGIVSLGEGSFRGCSSISRVELGDSIESIPDKTFEGCASLNYFILPKGILTIGLDAFKDCASLSKFSSKAKSLYNFDTNAFTGIPLIHIYASKDSKLANLAGNFLFPSRYENVRFTPLEEISLLDWALLNAPSDWKVGYVSDKIKNKRYNFDISGKNIYSFFTQDVSGATDAVFVFDSTSRTINLISVDEVGDDTAINISFENLANNIDISTSSDNIHTRYLVSGSDNLNINAVNFGDSHIANIDWFMNATDESGNLIYVSEELRGKYISAVKEIEKSRPGYIALMKKYNQAIIDSSEIKNRVPNDLCSYSWSQYSDAELISLLDTYNNTLSGIINDYFADTSGTTPFKTKLISGRLTIGNSGNGFTLLSISDGFVIDKDKYYEVVLSVSGEQYTFVCKPSSAQPGAPDSYTLNLKLKLKDSEEHLFITGTSENLTYIQVPDTFVPDDITVSVFNDAEIRNSSLYSDYSAYQYNIIPSINYEMYNRRNVFRNNGMVIGNSSSFENEYELYGINELNALSKKYGEVISSLIPSLRTKTNCTYPRIVYCNTDDIKVIGEEPLSMSESSLLISIFNSDKQLDYSVSQLPKSSTIFIPSSLEFDDTTTEYEVAYNSLKDAAFELEKIFDELKAKKEVLAEIESSMKNMERLIKIYNLASSYFENSSKFTPEECAIIRSLYHDIDYSDNNYFILSTDTIVTQIDVEKQLLKKARSELERVSQPQLELSSTIDNLIGIPEFSPLIKDFDVGNFIRVCYHNDYYIKLRLSSIEYNPMSVSEEDLTVSFYNITRSKSQTDDFLSILDKALGTGSSGSSSGSSGGGSSSGGDYGQEIKNLTSIVNALSNNKVSKEYRTGSSSDYKVLSDNNLTDELLAAIQAMSGTGSGSISYDYVTDKPSIGGIRVEGNKTLADYGIQPAGNYALISQITPSQIFIGSSQPVSPDILLWIDTSTSPYTLSVKSLNSLNQVTFVPVLTDIPTEHIWIKYSNTQPESDEEMKDEPDSWMGICVSDSETAPTSYEAYRWQRIKGDTGDGECDSVYVGNTEPIDDDVLIWLDTSNENDDTFVLHSEMEQNFSNYPAVKYNTNSQDLNTTQKTNARINIGAETAGAAQAVLGTSSDTSSVVSVYGAIALASEAKSIALGISATTTYDTLSGAVSTILLSDVGTLKLGDNLLIKETDVPDLWISGVFSSSLPYVFSSNTNFINALNTMGSLRIGYYEVSALESDKVDLSGYSPVGHTHQTVNGYTINVSSSVPQVADNSIITFVIGG